MNLGQRTKDSADVRVYAINCARFLGALSTTIASASFTVESGLTKDTESNTTTTMSVKVSGGTDGVSYLVSGTFVTVSGETKRVTFVVKIENG